MSLLYACMNSHIQHYTNALALSVMVGELMGGTLGMTLVGTTHRDAGVPPHLTPGPSPVLRHATRPTAPREPYGGSYRPHIAIIPRPTSISGGLGWYWQPRLIMASPFVTRESPLS